MERKAMVKFEAEGFAVSVPVRYTKISSAVIREQVQIVSRTTEGLEVSKKKRVYLGGEDITDKTESKMKWLDSNKQIREDKDVGTFQLVDGKPEAVKYPEATTLFQGFETIPAERFNSYLQESDHRYEVFADGNDANEIALNENFLVLLADYMIKNNVCLKMNEFFRSRDYFPYALVMRAHKEGDLYSVEFILTMTKLQYNHLMKKTDLKDVLVSEKKPTVKVKLNV